MTVSILWRRCFSTLPPLPQNLLPKLLVTTLTDSTLLNTLYLLNPAWRHIIRYTGEQASSTGGLDEFDIPVNCIYGQDPYSHCQPLLDNAAGHGVTGFLHGQTATGLT